MTSAVIIQARMGSTRLPGKVLMDLDGRTVLSWVLERCAAIPGIDTVVCATTTAPEDDAVVAEAERCGAVVHRGPAQDVLARYHGAAVAVGAQDIMRVTSDCPLIDPRICGQVLALRRRTGADYACNNMPPSWPHGLDCEAFTTDALARAVTEARQPHEREHVTPWLRTAPGIRRANLAGPGGPAARLRLTLDHPEDLALFRALVPLLPEPAVAAGIEAVLAALEAHPDIAAINAGRRDPARETP